MKLIVAFCFVWMVTLASCSRRDEFAVDYIASRAVFFDFEDAATGKKLFGRGKKFSPDSLKIKRSHFPADSFAYVWPNFLGEDHTEIPYVYVYVMGGAPVGLENAIMSDTVLFKLTHKDIDTLIIIKEYQKPFWFYYNGEVVLIKNAQDTSRAMFTVKK